MANDSEMDTVASTATGARPAWRRVHPLVWLVLLVVALDVVAFIVAPPFPKGGTAGDACAYPVCYINGTLEFPPPHVVWQIQPEPLPTGQLVIGFNVSITNTILTMWIVMAVRARAWPSSPRAPCATCRAGCRTSPSSRTRRSTTSPIGLGGAAATKYVPIYAAFFLLILFCNWSGLIPPVGRVEELRAPTSDVNITIGLALVSFVYFQVQGFRSNGAGYLSKFFPFYEFKNGVGAGLIAVFVGLVELMLEFVKPVTLAMRLFGNIYGGEVALGVLIALTIGIIPIAMYSLELLLTTVQALIFSVLTLMFTLAAVESHHHEEGELGEEAVHGGPAQQPVDRPAAA